MNWSRVILAGVIGGVVVTVANFVMHGLILAGTYTEYPDVFNQEGGGEAFFGLIGVLGALIIAVVFAKTRSAWPAGIAGGVACGALVGALPGVNNFYWPIVIEGFPYFLAWCWLGVDVVAFALGGAAIAAMIKRP